MRGGISQTSETLSLFQMLSNAVGTAAIDGDESDDQKDRHCPTCEESDGE
jgi:hypothetical protein